MHNEVRNIRDAQYNILRKVLRIRAGTIPASAINHHLRDANEAINRLSSEDNPVDVNQPQTVPNSPVFMGSPATPVDAVDLHIRLQNALILLGGSQQGPCDMDAVRAELRQTISIFEAAFGLTVNHG